MPGCYKGWQSCTALPKAGGALLLKLTSAELGDSKNKNKERKKKISSKGSFSVLEQKRRQVLKKFYAQSEERV